MRKISFVQLCLSVLILFSTFACEKKDEVITSPQRTQQLTIEQQTMRNALETTTNVLLDMIKNNPDYFDQLNRVIVAGSPDYLGDRVMLKDLFVDNSKTNRLRLKMQSKTFTSDFHMAFNRNKPLKIIGGSDYSSSILSNPDSLIQFLTDNNVSLYCPVPLEDYESTNRTPTITFHPIDNDSVNTGFLFDNKGLFSTVVVSQEYNEVNPVWVLMPYDDGAYLDVNNDMDSVSLHQVNIHNPKDVVYEVKLGQIYCKDYCSHFFEGTYLEIHVLRSLTTNIIDPSNWKATGTFSNAIAIKLDKKYVTYARKGWEKGWYTVNAVYDSNWSPDKTQQVLAIYEQDPTVDLKITGNAKFTLTKELSITDEKTGKTHTFKAGVEITAGCEANIKCKNDLLGVLEMERNWFMRTLKSDNGNQFRGSAFRNGYGIQALSNDFWYTMELRKL